MVDGGYANKRLQKFIHFSELGAIKVQELNHISKFHTLTLSATHYSLSTMGVGHGTNNSDELQVLALLLRLAVDCDLDKLQVLGDSKLIIDCMCGTVPFLNLGLQPLMDQVHSWRDCLDYDSFKHINSELNTLADIQSKDRVDVQLGMLKLQKMKYGVHTNNPP